MSAKVAILLSTYNGQKYLTAQLDSILTQTHNDFIILIRDDGSADNTPQLLEELRVQHPAVVHLLGSEGGNLGPCAGFACLMDYALTNKNTLGLQQAYLMFCDQDDVWYKDKIATELALLQKIETEHGANQPVLVHSDLRVVTKSGAVIADSFTRFQGLDAAKNKFSQVLVSNKVTGCTALINEALARKSLPVPGQAIMHDWWLGLVASAFGRTGFIDQPLLDYRQHEGNAIGAKAYPTRKILSRANLKKFLDSSPVSLHHDVADQAAAFLDCYRQELSGLQRTQLKMATALKSNNGILQRLLFRILS